MTHCPLPTRLRVEKVGYFNSAYLQFLHTNTFLRPMWAHEAQAHFLHFLQQYQLTVDL